MTFDGTTSSFRAAIFTGTTNGSGILTCTFSRPLPTGSVPVVVAALISHAGSLPFSGAPTATGFTIQAVGSAGGPIASTSVSVSYMALLPN